MRRCFVSVVIVVCFVILLSTFVFSQAPPSADTYVTTAMPASNFGSSAILPVQPGTTSFVQLNLGAFPANARIAKATLRLYVDAVAAPGSFEKQHAVVGAQQDLIKTQLGRIGFTGLCAVTKLHQSEAIWRSVLGT